MLSISINTVVAGLVRQHLQNQGREAEAMHFHFLLLLGIGDYQVHQDLHLLYHQKPHAGTLSVFSAVKQKYTPLRFMSGTDFKHEISHDSCWRDIQVFSKTYFAMAEEVNNFLGSTGRDHIAPNQMTSNVFLNLPHTHMYEWVPAQVSLDPNDSTRYRRKIELPKVC